MRSYFPPAALSGVCLLALATTALAIEPEAAAQALATAMAGGSNAKVSFGAVGRESGNVVIAGLTVDHGGKDKLVFDQTVIESPQDGGGGIFSSPKISFSGGALSGDAIGAIKAATLTGVTVLEPSAAKGSSPGSGLLFKTAEAGELSFKRKDGPGEMTVAAIVVEAGDVVDNVPQQSKGHIDDINIPAAFFSGGNFTPQTLGYENLVLGLTWDGSRNFSAKTMTLRDFTLTLQDGGDLSINGIMGNLPEPTALNDPDASSQASATEVHTITVRYEDKSLAGRVLDFLAKQQGISRGDYAQQISAALPFLLAALNNPEFQNELSGALGAFLQDPKSLTIKLQPEAPVSGSEILGLLGSAPQTLPDRLNASVSANSAE